MEIEKGYSSLGLPSSPRPQWPARPRPSSLGPWEAFRLAHAAGAKPTHARRGDLTCRCVQRARGGDLATGQATAKSSRFFNGNGIPPVRLEMGQPGSAVSPARQSGRRQTMMARGITGSKVKKTSLAWLPSCMRTSRTLGNDLPVKRSMGERPHRQAPVGVGMIQCSGRRGEAQAAKPSTIGP
jgi:hypothetical protein